MKVSEALASRISCRAFLARPVPEATVRAILEGARRSPSGGNVQPWRVFVLAGAPLRALIEDVEARHREQPRGEPAEYDIYPKNITALYRDRIFQCGADLYATLGIPREDKPARLAQFARNIRFFDAPVGLFFAVDRQMNVGQFADMGMFLQSIMLLAREHGLHTCPQEYWAAWHETVDAHLALPPELMLFCGMALGHMDEDAPVNALRTRRATVDEFATMKGF